MDIAEKLENALAGVLPVYGRTPEFGADNEPERYAVYNITEFPEEFGDGGDNATQYLCRLAVFTPALDFALYKQIKKAMRGAGFGYSSGGQVGTDTLFPYVTHYYLDFVGGLRTTMADEDFFDLGLEQFQQQINLLVRDLDQMSEAVEEGAVEAANEAAEMIAAEQKRLT